MTGSSAGISNPVKTTIGRKPDRKPRVKSPQVPTNDGSNNNTANRLTDYEEQVWVPDPEFVWCLGRVVDTRGDVLIVQTSNHPWREFNRQDVYPFIPSHGLNLENVAEMNDLHEAPLLDLLRRRYSDDQIYVREFQWMNEFGTVTNVADARHLRVTF